MRFHCNYLTFELKPLVSFLKAALHAVAAIEQCMVTDTHTYSRMHARELTHTQNNHSSPAAIVRRGLRPMFVANVSGQQPACIFDSRIKIYFLTTCGYACTFNSSYPSRASIEWCMLQTVCIILCVIIVESNLIS